MDDEECPGTNVTPPNSQTSSVEGVFAAPNRTSHPFRIIEHDALSLQSISSLGRVGRILGGLSIDSGKNLCNENNYCANIFFPFALWATPIFFYVHVTLFTVFDTATPHNCINGKLRTCQTLRLYFLRVDQNLWTWNYNE